MSRRGQRAALPGPQAPTARGVLGDGLVVRCFAQAGTHKDFDFTGLPVAAGLRRGLAAAFERRTAPGRGLTTIKSYWQVFKSIQVFADYLATLPGAPRSLGELAPRHIDGFVVYCRDGQRPRLVEVLQVKRLLAGADGVDDAMVAKCAQRHAPRPADRSKSSYSRAELAAVTAAARADLRAAAARIRGHRAELARYRAGQLVDVDRRLELLDFVDRHGDVPRDRRTSPSVRYKDTVVRYKPKKWISRHGTVTESVTRGHLAPMEAFAGMVLLTAMTGQNPGVITALTAVHHRADGHTGRSATAVLDTVKPRRGARAHMNLALEDVPDWIGVPSLPGELSARDELHTPFGVYALLVELTSRSRDITGLDSLFVAYHDCGMRGQGLRPITSSHWHAPWVRRHGLSGDAGDAADDAGAAVALRLELARIRLTYLELHQKPVAHREDTLLRDYLLPNRGGLAAYRQVVADTLAEQVAAARARGVLARLDAADLRRAHADPQTVAAEQGVEAATLRRLIAGELDTVMAGCVDDGTGPHATPGRECRASFMQCLSCPCARALPRHLPIQVLVHDQLEARRAALTPLAWTQRFGLPHAQLADLLERHDAVDVADARDTVSDADRALVERFLSRELDLR